MSEITTNEIRTRLSTFSVQWKNAKRENADAKLFWARFYECFGLRPESATIYEQAVEKLNGGIGFIDSFIPGLLIVEHKTKGLDLDKAYKQASEYFMALPEADKPRYIITSDFANFIRYDLKTGTRNECKLKDLSKHAGWFRFLTEIDPPEILEESPINRHAAYAVSKLHEALVMANFTGRDLEVFLTRLLFCFFADDTGIFGADGMFRQLVETTRSDGRDTGARLSVLFEVLNTSHEKRQDNLDEKLQGFAYINGSLFGERTGIPAFNSTLRTLLVACAELDWSGISPAIFGAMFQGVLEAHTPDESRQSSRRELGAHYTSERNILRVINPLFMDGLRQELASSARNKPRLKALYDHVATLNFLDPACGCGNFLVIAFRELRRFENEVIAQLFDFDKGRGLLEVSTLCRVRVKQFYGIEVDEAAVHITRVALWITDHQMNAEAAERFGNTRPTVPLIDSPTVLHANALRVDWTEVLPPEQCSYVMGNPPFIGHHNQTVEQKLDISLVLKDIKAHGVLDYVSAWYFKALTYIQVNPYIDVAFVSTNSITQGEQAGLIWLPLLQGGIHIRFAHRTFRWSNEGKGNAAVHCVIIGFGLQIPKKRTLFEYVNTSNDQGIEISAAHINPYLIDGPNEVLQNRRYPICPVPEMLMGNKPTDGGNLILSDLEKSSILLLEPQAEKWIRPFLGADEFINNLTRWCLWLKDISPAELRAMPEVYRRVEAVRAMRLSSKAASTRDYAAKPYLFRQISQPDSDYLLIPLTSSEKRDFVPIGYMAANVICSNGNSLIPNATPYHFAVLTSTMHNAWMRAVCGRLESRYRYSNTIVYNNFPWPTDVSDAHTKAIEAAAQSVLTARALYPESSLADLYDPLTMPPELQKAHQSVDKAVDAAYAYKGDKTDAPRVAYLFERYQALTSLLPLDLPKRKRAI